MLFLDLRRIAHYIHSNSFIKSNILLRYVEMAARSENHTNTVVHDHRQTLIELGELIPFVRREV
jgi:hypothetical protein